MRGAGFIGGHLEGLNTVCTLSTGGYLISEMVGWWWGEGEFPCTRSTIQSIQVTIFGGKGCVFGIAVKEISH